jgi:hypothetical protein
MKLKYIIAVSICFVVGSVVAQNNKLNYKSVDTTLVATSIENTYKEWYKTRYQMGGNSKRGIDCSHFAAQVYKNVYGKIISGAASDMYSKLDTTFVPQYNLQAGDLVFFNINGRHLSHVGVYVGNNEFVHATVHGGVLKSNLNETYYTRFYKCAGRFKQLTAQSYQNISTELPITSNQLASQDDTLSQELATTKIDRKIKIKHNVKAKKAKTKPKKSNLKKKSKKTKKQPTKTKKKTSRIVRVISCN